MLNHIWFVPLLPAAGALIQLLFGRRLSNRAVSLVSVGLPGVSFLWALGCFNELLGQPEHTFATTIYSWLPAGAYHLSSGALANLNVNVGFQLDPLSAVMLLVVTGVGFLIHIYSIGYMGHEGGYYRFFGYMNLFMFSMLVLVLADNYLMMFVGWEGVGLCSYLLIGFYFQRKSAADAGKKAFIVNRIGDAGFLLGLMLMAVTFGTLNFHDVTAAARSGHFAVGDAVITAICILIFVGATGKSAQIPLYVWLPDAMEGPTPVSALIHAATMVTAGVYMVARSNALFVLAPTALGLVAVIGAATAIWAASIGLVQNDIKRVLAYSTVSQLGYMFLACGVGAFTAGIFHLMTHAFFKARSEEHTSELQSPMYLPFPYTTLFRSLAPTALGLVAVIGAATAIWAASIGLVQNDIKRVLAYSTVSQLGYMFLACGVGAFTAGIFHLMTHAFFKA